MQIKTVCKVELWCDDCLIAIQLYQSWIHNLRPQKETYIGNIRWNYQFEKVAERTFSTYLNRALSFQLSFVWFGKKKCGTWPGHNPSKVGHFGFLRYGFRRPFYWFTAIWLVKQALKLKSTDFSWFKNVPLLTGHVRVMSHFEKKKSAPTAIELSSL